MCYGENMVGQVVVRLPEQLVSDATVEAELRGYGEGQEAFEYLVKERLEPFLRENINRINELKPD